jgi:hypothetical protein
LGGRSLGEDPSLQKITWNATTKTAIYRSKRHYTTKRNFQIFSAPDFIAAILRFREGSFECLSFVARRAKKGQAVESLRTQ